MVCWSDLVSLHFKRLPLIAFSRCHCVKPHLFKIYAVRPFLKSSSLSTEAQSSAMMFDCVYMELSASLDHGTNELLEAAVRAARGDCVGPGWTDGDPGSGRRESLTSRAKRFLAGLVPRSYGRDRDRDRGRYREMSRHRGSKILRQKSRSCHDLSALWHPHAGKETHSHTCTHTTDWRGLWKRRRSRGGRAAD